MSETKWENSFNIDSTSINWENNYKNIISLTIDTTFRSFQYKIVTIIIPTNKIVLKVQYVSSSFCTFCNANIKHLFWECPCSQDLSVQLSTLLRDNSFNVTISKTEALRGMSNSRPLTNQCNFIFIVMNYYIFKKKLEKSTPVFSEFKAILKYRIKTE